MKLQNGDRIRITYLPSCINGRGTPNPYMGMEGEVQGLNDKYFHLFTGNAYLCGIEVNACGYIDLENNVEYKSTFKHKTNVNYKPSLIERFLNLLY